MASKLVPSHGGGGGESWIVRNRDGIEDAHIVRMDLAVRISLESPYMFGVSYCFSRTGALNP